MALFGMFLFRVLFLLQFVTFLHFYLKIITCKQSETTFKIIVLSTEKPSKGLPRIYDQVLGSYDGKPTTGLFLCLLFCLQKK